MSQNLYEASKQWQSRPADERFSSLTEMLERCRFYRQHARQAKVDLTRLECVATGDELALRGSKGNPAIFSQWGFNQLCNRIGAPANYLRELPVELAASNIQSGLQRIGSDGAACNVLFHDKADSSSPCRDLIVRAFTSDRYARIWNDEIVSRLVELASSGNWVVPPARPAFGNQPGSRIATATDILPGQEQFGLSVKVGDRIAPAGLYASDHDCFAFMVNPNRIIADGTECGLARGFFVSNSEVGAAAFRVKTFLYRAVCGNHIVWDCSSVQELRIVHKGTADSRWASELRAELIRYSDSSASDDEARIESAKRYSLGNDKESVLDRVFGLRTGIARRDLDAAYTLALANDEVDGDSASAWGFAQGMTRLSQATAYADERDTLDRAAGKILQVAF